MASTYVNNLRLNEMATGDGSRNVGYNNKYEFRINRKPSAVASERNHWNYAHDYYSGWRVRFAARTYGNDLNRVYYRTEHSYPRTQHSQ